MPSAIRYSGGTTIYTDITSTTSMLIIGQIRDKCVLAGWTVKVPLVASAVFTLSGLPLAGQFVRIAGLDYTYRAAINNAIAREVLLGASANACAVNLNAAITVGAGSGTLYSTATTAGTCSSSVALASVTVTGPIATTIAQNCTAGSLSSGTLIAECVIQSAFTPARMAVQLKMQATTDSGGVTVFAQNEIGTGVSAAGGLAVLASSSYTIIACRYMAIVLSKVNNNNQFWISVADVPVASYPLFISSVTNSGGLFKITTTAAHGVATGQSVLINSNGFVPIDGNWVCTVVDATNITLNSSVFSAGWASGGNMAVDVYAGFKSISRAYWMFVNDLFRSTPTTTNLGNIFVNGTANSSVAFFGADFYTSRWPGGFLTANPARLLPVSGTTFMFFVWNTLIVNAFMGQNYELTGANAVDGHNWFVVGSASAQQMALITSVS